MDASVGFFVKQKEVSTLALPEGRGFNSNGGFQGNDPVLSLGKCICNIKTMPAILCKRPGACERDLTVLFSNFCSSSNTFITSLSRDNRYLNFLPLTFVFLGSHGWVTIKEELQWWIINLKLSSGSP